jgi:hypothetical protein
MSASSYEKTIGDWKPDDCIKPDSMIELSDPEVMAHLVTPEGAMELAEWMCGGRSQDGVIRVASALSTRELVARLVHFMTCQTAFSLLGVTMAGIPNFEDNTQFVNKRLQVPIPDRWYARLVKPSAMAAAFSMVNLPMTVRMEELQEAVASARASMSERDVALRRSVEGVAASYGHR